MLQNQEAPSEVQALNPQAFQEYLKRQQFRAAEAVQANYPNPKQPTSNMTIVLLVIGGSVTLALLYVIATRNANRIKKCGNYILNMFDCKKTTRDRLAREVTTGEAERDNLIEGGQGYRRKFSLSE
jgi:hypothetical protein